MSYWGGKREQNSSMPFGKMEDSFHNSFTWCHIHVEQFGSGWAALGDSWDGATVTKHITMEQQWEVNLCSERVKGLRMSESLCSDAHVPKLSRRIHLFDCKTHEPTQSEIVWFLQVLMCVGPIAYLAIFLTWNMSVKRVSEKLTSLAQSACKHKTM